MKTKEILSLDYRQEENKKIIQKVLKKIKPLSKYSDEEIPFEALEAFIRKAIKKYDFYLDFYISHSGLYYGCIKNTSNKKIKDTGIYGICIYELYAKSIIKIYTDIKSNKIALRSE